MTLTDFPASVAAEIARLETEIGTRCREIDRLSAERDGLSRLLSHLYPLRAAYEDAAPGVVIEPVEDLVPQVVEESAEPDPMETAAELAMTFNEPAPELQAEPFQAAVAELVATAIPEVEAEPVQELHKLPERQSDDLHPASPHGRGPDWPETDDARLIQLVGAGQTHSEIAAAMERTVPAVASRIRKLRAAGVKVLPPPGRREKATPQEVQEIRQLAAQGFTASGIGEKLGLSNRVVALTIKNAELSAAAEAERAKEPAAEPAQNIPILCEEPESLTIPPADEPPAVVAPRAESLPTVRAQVTSPAPRSAPVALVTEAIREVSRSDRPVLGRMPAIEPPRSTKPGTSDLRRKIAAHLDAVGHEGGWTPLRDLDLVEGICASRLPDTARRLNVTPEAAASRFKLLCQPIRHPKGGNDPQGQEVLAELLRERAAPRLEAAE